MGSEYSVAQPTSASFLSRFLGIFCKYTTMPPIADLSIVFHSNKEQKTTLEDPRGC